MVARSSVHVTITLVPIQLVDIVFLAILHLVPLLGARVLLPHVVHVDVAQSLGLAGFRLAALAID